MSYLYPTPSQTSIYNKWFNGRSYNEISWAEFSEVFNGCYVPESARDEMVEELSWLHQRGLSVSQYEQ